MQRRSPPLRLHNIQKMLGLTNGIGRIAEMIGTPEQAGASRLILPGTVIGIMIETGIRGFVNHCYDAFVFHPLEVRAHKVVVR